MSQPRKWHEVYENDEELRFFKALARSSEWDWRSVTAIADEAKLSEEKVEKLIEKYWKVGIVVQNDSNEQMWGYWERVKKAKQDDSSITEADQDSRIDDAMPCKVCHGNCGCGSSKP